MEFSPRTPAELEIFNFILSRAKFTYAEVAEHCDTSDWARLVFLRMLQRIGLVAPCCKEGRTQFYSVTPSSEPSTALSELATLPPPEPKSDEEKAIWNFVTERPYFTFEDVAMVCVIGAIRTRFMGLLKKHDLIREWGRSDGKVFYTTKTQEELRELAREARETPEGVIWTAVRHQKKFRPIDLYAAIAPARPDIEQSQILAYCRLLRKSGYLRASARLKSRKLSTGTGLLLVRNTGPLPPAEKRVSVVIDGNEDKIVYALGGRL